MQHARQEQEAGDIMPPAASAKGDSPEGPMREEMVDEIVTLIHDQIGEQRYWRAYGGEYNTLRELNGQLIIQTLPVHHAEIEALLATLRARRITRIEFALAERVIAPMLEKADALRLAERHAEALKLVNEALLIRPDHPRAEAMKAVIEETLGR